MKEVENLRFSPFHFKVLSYPRSRPLGVCLYTFGTRAGILHLNTVARIYEPSARAGARFTRLSELAEQITP